MKQRSENSRLSVLDRLFRLSPPHGAISIAGASFQFAASATTLERWFSFLFIFWPVDYNGHVTACCADDPWIVLANNQSENNIGGERPTKKLGRGWIVNLLVIRLNVLYAALCLFNGYFFQIHFKLPASFLPDVRRLPIWVKRRQTNIIWGRGLSGTQTVDDKCFLFIFVW